MLLSREAMALGLESRFERPDRFREWSYEFDPAGLELLRRAIARVDVRTFSSGSMAPSTSCSNGFTASAEPRAACAPLILPPFVEHLDSLLTGVGADMDSVTFKLTDPASGRLLGLRSDMTPQADDAPPAAH